MSEQAAIDVSILIISYNTRALTLACLDSVAAQTRCRHEVIVVDNASTDGSADAVACHAAAPRLIARTDNLGFARANNVAAAEAKGEFILLLNPDTVVLDGAIDRLLAFARARPEAMIWGGRTLFADGKLNASSCWGAMTPWNLLCRASGLTGLFPRSTFFNGEAYGGWPRDTVHEVDIVSGCFLLIRRETWERLGGFDPAFFMYGEEADLCLRARRLGARPAVTPEATIIHYGGASEATRSAKMVKLLAAKMTLIRRHWRPALVPLGVLLMATWPLSRALATGLLARLAPSPSRTISADAWREIWQRRAEWLGGYAAAPEQPMAPAEGRALTHR